MKFINNIFKSQLNKLQFKFGLIHTFIFLLSFATNILIFKQQSIALICALISLKYIIIPDKKINLAPLPKLIYLYINIILFAFLGSLATVNLYFSIALNLLIPFIIINVYVNKANPKGYSFYYMIFTYTQFLNINLKLFIHYLLAALIGLIIGYVFQEMIFSKTYKNKPEETFIAVISDRLKASFDKFKQNLNLELPSTRFSIRLSLATAFSIILWKYLALPKWYWISMSTCYTLIPVYSEISSRVFFRIRSTIIGAVLFMIFYSYTKNLYIIITLSIVAVILILSYIPYNHLSEIYMLSTFVALSLSTFSISSTEALKYRISYVITGSLIALLFNRFILPERGKVEVQE